MDTTLFLQELLLKIDQLTSRVELLENENQQLRQDVLKLRVENTELKARLNTNSKNSSKPPSQDGYSKKPVIPKAIKGQQGGQYGHSGTTLGQIGNPDKIVRCLPKPCSCGHVFTEDQIVIAEKRQVFDLPQPAWKLQNIRYTKLFVQ